MEEDKNEGKFGQVGPIERAERKVHKEATPPNMTTHCMWDNNEVNETIDKTPHRLQIKYHLVYVDYKELKLPMPDRWQVFTTTSSIGDTSCPVMTAGMDFVKNQNKSEMETWTKQRTNTRKGPRSTGSKLTMHQENSTKPQTPDPGTWWNSKSPSQRMKSWSPLYA